MITSAYSKSSNSSRFNPILKKFYEMICKIIISKTVCGIFLIFCRSSFISNFFVENNFLEPKNYRKLKNSRPIYFLKISAHCFCTNKLEGFFFKKIFFQGLGAFFKITKPLFWCHFFTQKYDFILFLKGNYLILI